MLELQKPIAKGDKILHDRRMTNKLLMWIPKLLSHKVHRGKVHPNHRDYWSTRHPDLRVHPGHLGKTKDFKKQKQKQNHLFLVWYSNKNFQASLGLGFHCLDFRPRKHLSYQGSLQCPPGSAVPLRWADSSGDTGRGGGGWSGNHRLSCSRQKWDYINVE